MVTDGNGNFEASFMLPAGASGAQVIKASQLNGRVIAAAMLSFHRSSLSDGVGANPSVGSGRAFVFAQGGRVGDWLLP